MRVYLSEVGVGEGVLRRRKIGLGGGEGGFGEDEEGEGDGEDIMVEVEALMLPAFVVERRLMQVNEMTRGGPRDRKKSAEVLPPAIHFWSESICNQSCAERERERERESCRV